MQKIPLTLNHRYTDWSSIGHPKPILTPRQYAWITLAFVGFVIYGSLVPLTFRFVPIDQAWQKYVDAFSQPVAMDNRADWLANILLFIPLGFTAMGWRSVDAYRLNPLSIATILISCGLLSASIEFTQLFFPPRQTSINDVAAETLGGAIGILGWLIAGQRLTDYLRQLWSSQGEVNWALRLLPGYLLLLVFVHGMPFDLTISPDQLKRKYHEGRVLLTPFMGEPLDVVKKRLINIAYFLPVGILLGGLHGWFNRGSWAWLRALATGIAVAGAIEFMQLIVLTRFFDTTDIITGSLAVVAGWQLMRLRQYRCQAGAFDENLAFPTVWRLALFLFWSAALLFINWEPFDFAAVDWRERLEGISWVPFTDYYAGNYLRSFDEIVEKTVLFVPFGLLLGLVLRSRLGTLIMVVCSALLLSVSIEIGQIFLPKHNPGVSDLLIETFGAFAGAIAAGRLRSLTSNIPVAEVVPNRAYVG